MQPPDGVHEVLSYHEIVRRPAPPSSPRVT